MQSLSAGVAEVDGIGATSPFSLTEILEDTLTRAVVPSVVIAVQVCTAESCEVIARTCVLDRITACVSDLSMTASVLLTAKGDTV